MVRDLEPIQPTHDSLAFDPMIQLYYQNFHGAHPFILPRVALNGPLGRELPLHLVAMMRHIGAHFHPDPSFKDMYRRPSHVSLLNDTPRNGFSVQSLLLSAITDHAHGLEERASTTLRSALQLALELGMNKSSFATGNSSGYYILEESWRRTYWELYVVSGLLASIGGEAGFTLHSQPSDLPLPCGEAAYASAIVSRWFLACVQLIDDDHTLISIKRAPLPRKPSNESKTAGWRIQRAAGSPRSRTAWKQYESWDPSSS